MVFIPAIGSYAFICAAGLALHAARIAAPGIMPMDLRVGIAPELDETPALAREIVNTANYAWYGALIPFMKAHNSVFEKRDRTEAHPAPDGVKSYQTWLVGIRTRVSKHAVVNADVGIEKSTQATISVDDPRNEVAWRPAASVGIGIVVFEGPRLTIVAGTQVDWATPYELTHLLGTLRFDLK